MRQCANDRPSRRPMFAYPYVGPARLRDTVGASFELNTEEDLPAWLRTNTKAEQGWATFVVLLDGSLRLAPRRSEHVACAAGLAVLAAGELRFSVRGDVVRVVEASNQSTGYCPDVECWEAVSAALARAGVDRSAGLTRPIIFRRCMHCREVNLVKDGWFVCAFCDTELAASWNVSARLRIAC